MAFLQRSDQGRQVARESGEEDLLAAVAEVYPRRLCPVRHHSNGTP